MKKYWWIAVTLAALALVFSGCPGAGDKVEADDYNGAFWIAPDDVNWETELPNNTINLTLQDDGSAYVHIFFEPYGKEFSKINIEFALSDQNGLQWQCAYDGAMESKWARSNGGDNYIDLFTPGAEYPASCNPATMFTGGNWGTPTDGWDKLDLPTMRGVCFQIVNGTGTFRLVKVSFTK